MRLTILFLVTLLSGGPSSLKAQVVSGNFADAEVRSSWLVLLATRGGEHYPIDSVRIGNDGRFRFAATKLPGAGFYQLSLHDTDRVDLILNGIEPEVELAFIGRSLQRTIRVQKSAENQSLWRYKAASREAQAVQEMVAREKSTIDPLDQRHIRALDSVEHQALQAKEARMKALVAEAPNSYFARVVTLSDALDLAVGGGPDAVSKLFDFGDPDLLRSSVYDKGVMSFFQSIHVISEEQLTNAADTLMRLSARNRDCQSYMAEHLVDLFTAYGPQSTLQHVVDRYLAGADPAVPMSPQLKAKVDAMLAVSIGAIGPDADLVDSSGAITKLSTFASKGRYTLLFVYSSTCDHCHKQMPGVNELHSRYQLRGLRVAGIALDADRAEFRKNIQEQGLRFPCFSEFTGWGSNVAKAYAVKATPTLILLDNRLRIVSKPLDADGLAIELLKLLP